MITTFNKENLVELRADIEEALKSVRRKHNITASIGNISYSGHQLHTKLTCNVKNSDGAAITKEEVDYNYLAANGQLDSSLIGSRVGDRFTSDGREFEILGYNSKAPKNKIKVKGADGKPYKLSLSVLISCVAKNGLIKTC